MDDLPALCRHIILFKRGHPIVQPAFVVYPVFCPAVNRVFAGIFGMAAGPSEYPGKIALPALLFSLYEFVSLYGVCALYPEKSIQSLGKSLKEKNEVIHGKQAAGKQFEAAGIKLKPADRYEQ